MQCLIEGPNIKALAKAVQALARIGDDLYIESVPSKQLAFRTVNSSRSAYVCITFDSDFFAEFTSVAEAKCKVSLKSCLMAFRSLPTLERSVEKCLLDTGQHDCILLIQFHCKHDMMKIYHLPFIENETVLAALPTHNFQCKLTAQARLLIDGIQNFSNSVENVTFTVGTNKVTVKNYIEDIEQDKKVVHTELILESEEFESYDVEEETEVTFCLKEFRAIMNFSEGFNVPVTINCQNGGKPIMFSVDGIPGLLANFMLATVAEWDAQSVSSQSVGKQTSQLSLRNKQPTRAEKKSLPRDKNKPSVYPALHVVDSSESESDAIDNDPSASIRHVDSVAIAAPVVNSSQNSPTQNPNEDDDDDDVIPLTPPKKRFRYEFLGLSQASQYTSMAPDPDEVLAEASDEDYD